MAKLEWEVPTRCPIVNGYVVRIMTTAPEPARLNSACGKQSGIGEGARREAGADASHSSKPSAVKG